jgi:hypothetical protein
MVSGKMGAVPEGRSGKNRNVTFRNWNERQEKSTGGFWPNRKGVQLSSFAGVRRIGRKTGIRGEFK